MCERSKSIFIKSTSNNGTALFTSPTTAMPYTASRTTMQAHLTFRMPAHEKLNNKCERKTLAHIFRRNVTYAFADVFRIHIPWAHLEFRRLCCLTAKQRGERKRWETIDLACLVCSFNCHYFFPFFLSFPNCDGCLIYVCHSHRVTVNPCPSVFTHTCCYRLAMAGCKSSDALYTTRAHFS